MTSGSPVTLLADCTQNSLPGKEGEAARLRRMGCSPAGPSAPVLHKATFHATWRAPAGDGFSVTASLAEVDAVVTDSKGHYIADPTNPIS